MSGRLLENEGEFVLEESVAHSAGIKIGDDVRILARGSIKPQHVQLVGLIRPTDIWAFTQGGLAYFNLEDWQWMWKEEGKIDALQIGLVPSVDKQQALDALARALPSNSNLQLRPAHEDGGSSSVTLEAFQIGLETTRTLAVLVAFLLIFNTFLMNVTERRAQIGVLRLIGSLRAQVMRLFLREATVIGIVGAVLGLPLGWLLAHWLARSMENAFGIKVQAPEVALWATLFAFTMGPVVAWGAAFWPARRASRIGPLENLRQRASGQPPRIDRRITSLGSILVVVSLTIFFWRGPLSQELSLTGALFFLVGLLFTLPTMLPTGYALLYHLLHFLGPMEFELACRQLVRTQGRALLTWGILFLAVAVSVATGLILTDVINDIRGEVRRTTLADFIIRVTQVNLATGTSAKLPEDLRLAVSRLEGVKSVEAIANLGLEIPAAGRVVAVVREFDLHERPPLKLSGTSLQDVRQKMLDGEIVLSDILAYKLQKKAGDEVTAIFEGKDYSFRVAGTTRFYLAGGMAFFIDRQVAERKFGPIGADGLLIDAKPGQQDALAHRLIELSQQDGLLFQTYDEVQARLESILNTVVASLWVLLALGFLIAVFGVTNTLMMNILEQTREIGLMRVLGMQRRQIRRMVLAQSAYVGILAIIPGFMAGATLAYVIRSSALAVLGDNPHFGDLLPWLAPYAVGLLGLVLMFGWLPAARAARLNILESIRNE
jgi:putative ABC transport system permease protein